MVQWFLGISSNAFNEYSFRMNGLKLAMSFKKKKNASLFHQLSQISTAHASPPLNRVNQELIKNIKKFN
jgi:hypothetical protein